MQHKHDDNIKFLTLLVNGPRILGNMLGNGMHMLSNGPHVLLNPIKRGIGGKHPTFVQNDC